MLLLLQTFYLPQAQPVQQYRRPVVRELTTDDDDILMVWFMYYMRYYAQQTNH